MEKPLSTTWKERFEKRFGRFYFGKDANSEEAFNWEKTGTEKVCICSGNVLAFIQSLLEEERKDERLAWINGYRCEICGKEKDSDPLSNVCADCFETA